MVPAFSEWRLPEGFRRVSWGEVKPEDFVWLLSLVPNPDGGEPVGTCAVGPFEVLGWHRLRRVIQTGFEDPLNEYSERLLKPVPVRVEVLHSHLGKEE